MNEELKAILETLSSLGEGSFLFACLWLAKGFISVIVGYGVLLYVILRASKIILGLIGSYQTAREIARSVGYDCRGDWAASDTKKVLENIETLKTKARSESGSR